MNFKVVGDQVVQPIQSFKFRTPLGIKRRVEETERGRPRIIPILAGP